MSERSELRPAARLVATGLLALALAGCGQRSSGAPPAPDSSAPESSAPESSTPGVPPIGFELVDVEIVDGDGTVHDLRLWLAATPEQRGRGLMDVTDLGPADGMLFVFDDEAVRRFYMWNTPIALSIAFFDGAGRFVGSAEMMPCLDRSAAQCERYAPEEPFQSAIELPRGDLEALGIGPGARLESVSAATEPTGTTDA